VDLRWKHPIFTRQKWFQGRSINGSELHDIAWFSPEGHHMTEENWMEEFAKCIMIFMNGKAIPGRDPRGNVIEDNSFLILVNAYHETVEFTLPGEEWAEKWKIVLDTSAGGFRDNDDLREAGTVLAVEGKTFILAEKEAENGS
jgi:glycogen operon protein